MHKSVTRRTVKLTKAQAKALSNAIKEMDKELDKQMDIIYHAAAIALYRYHGWKTDELHSLIKDVSQSIWNECAELPDESMIEMLWNEVGIEVMSEETNQRWFEVSYLNSELVSYEPMTFYQTLAMRQNQKKWIAPQLTACILMCLWREKGWKEEALGKLFGQIEIIKHENNMDPDALRKVCFNETDFCITDDVEELTKGA